MFHFELASSTFFFVLIIAQGLTRLEGASSDADVEDEVINDDASSVVKDTLEEQSETIGASPDAYVSFLFTQPENSKDLPGGKLVKFLIGFHNRGEKDFIVRHCETSFRYPQDFSYHIQNFTLARYERVVAPKQEASFDYAFFPSEQFAGRPLGLVVELHYVDSEGAMFMSTLFNETVMIVEDESNFNTETGFLYIIFAAAVVLILLAGQHFLSKLTRKHGMAKNRQQSQVIETGTSNKNEVDFEWIPREVLNHNKSPKPGSPRQRKPVTRID